MRKKILIVYLICFLLISNFSAGLIIKNLPKGAEYEIFRDKWGIAHVISETDEGAFFGAGYATAQDRLFQMHRNRRAVQGRLAELIGDIVDDNVLQSIIAQDKYMRHIGLYRYAEFVSQQINQEYRNALNAYCNGVNEYIEENQNSLLFLFAGEVPEDWTVADCIASWDRLGAYFSGFPSEEAKRLHDFEDLVEAIGYEQAIEAMTNERIIDDDAAVTKYEDYDSETLDEIFEYAENNSDPNCSKILDFANQFFPKMSHAWVVGGSRTTTGSAVLSSDPQTKVTSPSIWYEIHMKGASFNVRGIGVAGCPGFIVGWNENVAWGATALGADQADLFRLKMIDENTYEYDGEQHDMSIYQEIIKVKGGRDVSITVKETILGPVVTDLLSSVYPGEEYVLCSFPQWDKKDHSVEALLDMMDANNAYSFYTSIQEYRNPGINCIYGDLEGNIGYSVMAGIPLRSLHSPLAGGMAQNGSSSDYAWVEMIPYRVLPHIFNPEDGVIFTANHLSVGSWYPIPLNLGQGGSGDGSRSWRLRELLDIDDDIDFSPEDVYDVHYDTVDPRLREIVRMGLYIRDVQGHTFSNSADNALDLLESWFNKGARCVTTEDYYAAAHHMDLYFREERWPNLTSIYGGGGSGLCFFLKTIKDYLDNNSSYGFNETEIEFFEYALSSGYNRAVSFYGSNPSDWMDKFSNNGPGEYKIKYFDTLENFGSLDRNLDKSYKIINVNGGGIGGQMGQSYSQWVNLADIHSSRAILPVGNSENPNDPHFNDQVDIWLNLQMRSSPLKNSLSNHNQLIQDSQIKTDFNELLLYLLFTKTVSEFYKLFMVLNESYP